MVTLEQRKIALIDAVREALETLVFSEVEVESGRDARWPPGNAAAIELGELGELILNIRPQALRELASVIYTLEPTEIDEGICRDTLMEILNIVAGRFCLKIVDENKEFQLGIPHQLLESPSIKTDDDVACSLCLDGEETLQIQHKPSLLIP